MRSTASCWTSGATPPRTACSSGIPATTACSAPRSTTCWRTTRSPPRRWCTTSGPIGPANSAASPTSRRRPLFAAPPVHAGDHRGRRDRRQLRRRHLHRRPANGEADPLEPMDEVELEQRLATVLPGGWKLGQVHAEQPTTTFGEFKREILNEIARCLNMPFNVAAGNSSGYNYASGRLDHQVYFKSIRVEQHQMQLAVLDRILKAWLNEAVLVEGLLPQSLRTIARTLPEHAWFWDGVEHVDPAKEANAQATRLANHTTTLAVEFARQGRDWEQELRQRAKELARS